MILNETYQSYLRNIEYLFTFYIYIDLNLQNWIFLRFSRFLCAACFRVSGQGVWQLA